MERIVLVGFSGAGKSTVARRLASRLGWDFSDTDTVIQNKYHLSISDFFEKYGENAFRICEQSVMRELLEKHFVVIATGGGMPCFFNNMDELLEKSLVIYLKLSPLSLFYRLKFSHKERPLTDGKTEEELLQYVQTTLEKREPFYERAHLVIKGENLSMNELVGKLQELGCQAASKKE